MPQLKAIGIVASDMARSIRFYRLLGLDVPDTPDEAHVDAFLPNGVRFMLDSEQAVRSFRPEWTRQTGNQVALALECESAGEVDAVYARVVEAGFAGEKEPWDAFWGQRYAQLGDPDGVPVDLYAQLLIDALIEERLELPGRSLSILRPPSADELIDEEAFDEDEFLPYWAELWPSGVALAHEVARLDVRGLRVLELGCGLGLPSLAAALGGADVLATDWAEEAVALLRRNAERNGLALRAERVRWDEPEPLEREAPWDLVLGADLLYEVRNAEQLAALLPRLGPVALLADPGRPFAPGFLARAAERRLVETHAAAESRTVKLHRLSPRAAARLGD